MKVVITGSTGMLGQGVLKECLDSPMVESVLCLNRSLLNIKHDKLEELLIDDFFDLSAIEEALSQYDTFFYCLGTSSAGVSDEHYQEVTIKMPLYFAETVHRINPKAVFTYISAEGADKNSKTMWAKVKGTAEESLKSVGIQHTYIFRPAITFPDKNIEIRNKVNRITMRLLAPFKWIIKKLFPNYVTTTSRFGQAMILASSNRKTMTYHTLGCKEINELTRHV